MTFSAGPAGAARDGAAHYIYGPYLGSQIDAEMDGQPTLGANGDDLADIDDEDGVEFVGLQLIPGDDSSQVLVTLNGAAGAMLEAWIDFNGDGVWADEYATTGVIDPAGQHDEFILTARDPGQVGTRIGVVFQATGPLNVSYDIPTRILTIVYEPGTTTVADLVSAIQWLPATCAYRLRAEGKPLPDWHPLVSGDPDTVRTAGISIAGRVLSESFVPPEALDDYIIRWVE